jgi:anti-sigma factor RsiW
MTTPLPIDDDLLQRFYDGDLTPLEEHGVQAQIEADPRAQRRLAELGRVTELVRQGTSELSGKLDANALFSAIEAKLAQPSQVPVTQRLRVRTSEWLEHRRGTVVALFGTTALAAASLLAVLRPGGQLPEGDGALVLAPGELRAPVVPTALEAPHGSNIEDVDFGASTGTVFELDNEGVAVAVVWINDDEGP